MLTTNIKRSVAALAVAAGVLVAAGPANAAWYAKFDGVDGSVVAAPAENATRTLKAGASEVLYETVTVKAKPAKGKHAKGKHAKGKVGTAAATLVSVREKGSGLATGVVAHGGQRGGAILDIHFEI